MLKYFFNFVRQFEKWFVKILNKKQCFKYKLLINRVLYYERFCN